MPFSSRKRHHLMPSKVYRNSESALSALFKSFDPRTIGPFRQVWRVFVWKQDGNASKNGCGTGRPVGRRGQGKDRRRAERAVFSAVARYAGGHNAGHTVIIGDQKFVLQLIPCGVLRPGCKGVIGNGVVLDPIYFLDEVDRLRKIGVDIRRASLRLQSRAGDPALPPHDRAGRRERAGPQEDRHHQQRHRPGLRGQDGAQRPARRRSAAPCAAQDAH